MAKITPAPAANEVYRLPPPLFDARSRATVLVDSLGQLDFPATAARVGRDGRLRPR